VTFLPEDADLVNDNLRRGGRVYATILGAGVEHELSLSAYATTRDYPGGFVPRFEGDRLTLGYTGTWQRDVGTLVLGAEHVRETAEIAGFSGYVGKTERNSIYGEVLIERGAFDVSLASRLDHSEDFGTNSSNRIALAYDVSPDLTLKTVLGTGFRAPSLDERFASYGNPGLEVEKSESVEFGLVRRFASGAALEVVAYYTEIDNRIEFDGSSVACASGFGCFEQSDTATF
jgi:vitamin B12 transporter